jgi:hypothetical protein
MLAFTVLGGLGGFLLAHLVNPWLRGEEPWMDDEDILEESWNDSLEDYGPSRQFRLIVHDEAGRRIYDWAEDADPKD